MRILIVTPASPLRQGGVERHVLEVSRRFAAAGQTVAVLCTDPGGPARAVVDREGVRILSVRAWPAYRDWRFAPAIWPELGRGRWDLVHVQSYHTLVAPLAMLRALRLGVPYVLTFHGGGHSSRLRHRLRGAQRWMLRPLLVRAARLVAVARFEIDLYGRELRIPREKFVLIPNGTEIDPHVDVERNVGDVDGSGADRGPVLASIGRLERYKGHQRVLAAFPHVLAAHPDAQLLIVGSGPYEDALRKQIADLRLQDRVELTSVPQGDSEGMAALLARVDLVVLLSEFETHPLTGLEAAAAGRRLLVADNGGLLELARDGLGRAISPHSAPEKVASAILEELERPPPPPALSLTTWDECAAALLDLYRSIV